MCDQLKTLDYRLRKAVLIGKCPDEVMVEVLAKIKPLLFA
jgi:mRNA interferase MazF